jgi:hypothetical protein
MNIENNFSSLGSPFARLATAAGTPIPIAAKKRKLRLPECFKQEKLIMNLL